MESKKSNILMLIVLCAGGFSAAFSENIINVALTDIVAEFSIDTVTAQWLVTGYMIVACVMNASVAFLVQRFAIKPLFTAAALIYIVGLAAAFVAPNFQLLLVFRLMQAIGTGIFIPLMLMCILALAPQEKLATFLAVGNCCISLGPAFGPVIAGVMVSLFGWRFVFVPLCVLMIILVVVGQFVLKNISEPSNTQFDVASGALAAVGLTFAVFGLSQIVSNTLMGLVMLALGCAVLGVFAKRQLKLEEPFLDIRPLANFTFLLYAIIAIVEMTVSFSSTVLLPLYYQGALDIEAWLSGGFILVAVVVNAAGAILAGRIMDKHGVWPVVPVGFILSTAGLAGICVLSFYGNAFAIVVCSCFVFLGLALVFSPAQAHGLSGLDKQMANSGVSLISVFTMAAGALGPSLFVGVMQTKTDALLAAGELAQLAQISGFSQAVFVATVISTIGLIVSFVFTKQFWKK